MRDIEHEVVPACLDAGMGLLPWSPLGGGWLTGSTSRDVPPTGPTRLGDNPERGMEAWAARNADERTWRVVDCVRAVAREGGTPESQVALAWVAAQPAVTSVILGARTVARLLDNMGAADLDLGEEALTRLTGRASRGSTTTRMARQGASSGTGRSPAAAEPAPPRARGLRRSAPPTAGCQ